MQFTKSVPVSLKSHAEYNEKWLQQVLADDPSLLGLGDLILKDIERRQHRAGRLDLLLTDPENATRYEVEIQLGATDETHIIRTIEYWDIEKTRYPQYEHIAVIVAEDITSRFLNVISLFNKAIPLIAIQIRALQVGGNLTLSATKVLDVTPLGTDEEDEPGLVTDRNYWLTRGSQTSVGIVDELLKMVNELTPGMGLKYTKNYIGLAKDGIADLYVLFRPRKEHVVVEFRIPRSDEVTKMVEDSGLDAGAYATRWGRYRIRVAKEDLKKNQQTLVELIRLASGTEALPGQE